MRVRCHACSRVWEVLDQEEWGESMRAECAYCGRPHTLDECRESQTEREPKMTLAEYNKAQFERQEIIRQNASRRMKHLPALPVPDKPTPPLVPIAYSPSGDYIGRLEDESDCPAEAIVKWEIAKW